MGFMETSAKLKVNIEETFDLIVRRVIEARSDLGGSLQFPRQRPLNNDKDGEAGAPETDVIDEKQMSSGSCKCCIIS